MISFTSCKKGDYLSETSRKEKIAELSFTTASRFQDSMYVTSYGFLNFLDVDNLEDYHQFVVSHTHREVQAYLDSIRFTSYCHSVYGSSVLSDTVTDVEFPDYVFNADKVFQVENAIVKPVEEVTAEVKWQFLLVMTPVNLSSTSYTRLAAGEFDANTMNQFAANPASDSLSLFDVLNDTPTGIDETTANSDQAARPMFGHTSETYVTCGDPNPNPVSGICQKYCEEDITTEYYAFWIKVKTKHTTGNSYPVNLPAGDCH